MVEDDSDGTPLQVLTFQVSKPHGLSGCAAIQWVAHAPKSLRHLGFVIRARSAYGRMPCMLGSVAAYEDRCCRGLHVPADAVVTDLREPAPELSALPFV